MNTLHTKKTINEKELETQKFWYDAQIFEKTLAHPASLPEPRGSFSFYDGPPFATGLPHHGHILAGTIKDMIPRYQTMRGNYVRRVWGWDCHGLPVENLIEKKLGLNHKKEIDEYGIDKFNEEAKNSVLEYESEWKRIVPRLGRFIDMENPYKTMDSTYTESIWWSFKELHSKGLVYEGHKIMHICTRCETSLAQSEVALGYKDVTDISVTVKLELVDEPHTYLLAWTTTPWTLPGNVAAAVSQDSSYAYITITGDTHTGNTYVVAEERIAYVTKGAEYRLVKKVLGKDLIGKTYIPPFDYYRDVEFPHKENAWKVWHADFVTLDTGTGIVHEAPAFGAEDMELAKLHNLPVIKHVKMDGMFTPEIIDFGGLYVKKKDDTQSTDIEIIKKLAHTGKLFAKEKLIHSYPHCWRCDTPLLNYATSSWFVDVPKIKNKLISENQKVTWVPDHIRDGRFGKWLEGAREWAVSRSRYWGAPIPVWKCDSCNTYEVIGSLDELGTKLASRNTYTVMRHGECTGNAEDRADSGTLTQNGLTEKGKKEVEKSLESLASHIPDKIYVSPLQRAQETARIIAEKFGISPENVITDERLIEFNFGIYSGLPFNDFWDKVKYLHTHFDKKIEGGESFRDVSKRAMNLLFEIEKSESGKHILFVTHGAPMWMLIAGAKHMSDAQTKEYRHARRKTGEGRYFLPNAVPEKLEYTVLPNNGTELDFHRPYIDEIVYTCECGGMKKRIPEVFDCWYESGSMPFAQVHYPFENQDIFKKSFPADFIAEGMDQTRGWFYSLINLSVGLFDIASFKHVIVNGLTLADNGQKMSKSLKNYTDPLDLIEQYGADALRYYMISSPIVRGENLSFSDDDLGEVYRKVIMRLENVYSFYKMYSTEHTELHNKSTNVLDMYILSRLSQVISDATSGLDAYELDKAVKGVDDFIDDLSTWYVRRSRERMKGEYGEADTQSALATLGFVLREFSKVIAPVMPFIAERLYLGVQGEKESVHLESWPTAGDIHEDLLKDMKALRSAVSELLMIRTKSKISVRQPLSSATVTLQFSDELQALLKDEVNIKNILVGNEYALDITISPELRAEGELREIMRVVKDLRGEANLTPEDRPVLHIYTRDRKLVEENKDFLLRKCLLQSIVFSEVPIEGVSLVVGEHTYEFSLS